MLSRKLTAPAISSLVVVLAAACGTSGSSQYPASSGYPSASSYPNAPASATGTRTTNLVAGFGVVQGIDLVPRQSAGLGVGTVAGAVVGGVIGHQVGSGSGNTAATIAGAAGGALAGRAIENRTQQASQVYRLTLRMDDGTVQSLVQESLPSLRIGDRIRIQNGVIERL